MRTIFPTLVISYISTFVTTTILDVEIVTSASITYVLMDVIIIVIVIITTIFFLVFTVIASTFSGAVTIAIATTIIIILTHSCSRVVFALPVKCALVVVSLTWYR